MPHNPFRSVAHASKMMLRNRKSYALLSVTIVLSFSVLLCYLGFVDSGTYHDYKEVFAVPGNVVMAEKQGDHAAFYAFTTCHRCVRLVDCVSVSDRGYSGHAGEFVGGRRRQCECSDRL